MGRHADEQASGQDTSLLDDFDQGEEEAVAEDDLTDETPDDLPDIEEGQIDLPQDWDEGPSDDDDEAVI